MPHARINVEALKDSITSLSNDEQDLYKQIIDLTNQSVVSYQSKEKVLHLVNETLFQKLVSDSTSEHNQQER